MQATTPSTPIRMIIADDYQIFREGLIAIFSRHSDLAVLGTTDNGNDLIKLVGHHLPDIILTDIKMPGMDGLSVTRALKVKYPSLGIIALSMFDDETNIMQMFAAGAFGYLLKTSSEADIVHAVRTVHQGNLCYFSDTWTKLTDRLVSNHTLYKGKKTSFSEREIDIIKMICREFSSKEIADQLGTSRRSVERSRERIQEKIGAKNMISIVIYALRQGIARLE